MQKKRVIENEAQIGDQGHEKDSLQTSDVNYAQ